MEQHVFGALVGAASILAGYILNELSQMRSKELSYLHLVPQFTNLKELRNHLATIPDQTADVLVEGVVKKLGSEVQKSEKAGVEGVAKLVTTTSYKKVYHSQSNKWNDVSSTIENLNVSIPFKLEDVKGNSINIQTIHNAGGYRQILNRVWQEKTIPEARSIADHATNITIKEIPNGTLTREFLLLFGTSVGAYGTATLQGNSLISSGTVTFTPTEVSSSIEGLITKNEVIVSTFKFFSVILLVGGGGVLFLSIIPLLRNALQWFRDTDDN